MPSGTRRPWVSDTIARTESALAELRATRIQVKTDFDLRIRALEKFRARITCASTLSTSCQTSPRIARLITAPLAGLR